MREMMLLTAENLIDAMRFDFPDGQDLNLFEELYSNLKNSNSEEEFQDNYQILMNEIYCECGGC